MGAVFLFFYRTTKKYKAISLGLLILLISVSIFFVLKVNLVEDITKVLPENQNIKNMNFVLNNLKFMDKVVFNIYLKDSTASPSPELLTQFAHEFIDTLKRRFMPDYLKTVNAGFDEKSIIGLYDTLYSNLPLFLDEKDYLRIDTLIQPQEVKRILENNYKTLLSPLGLVTKSLIQKDPLNLSLIALDKFTSFQLKGNFELYNNFIITKDHRHILVFATLAFPDKIPVNDRLFSGIDKSIETLNSGKFNKINVEYFSSALVVAGNAKRIKKDIIHTLSIALFVLIIFISIFFRRKRAFLVILLPVVLGGLVSIAAISVFKSEISAISLGIGSIILGISVDYALHIFSHYRKNLSVEKVIKELTTPILISSITTASAFLSLYLIHSKALNDLGLFAAISVFSSAIFSLVVLPHLIGKTENREEKQHFSFGLDKVAALNLSGNKLVVYGILIVTLIFIFTSRGVYFEPDMMKSNYMSNKLRRTEKRLNNISGVSQKTLYLVSTGPNLDSALSRNEQLLQTIDNLNRSGAIKNETIISRIIPSKDEQKKAIIRWQKFWASRADKLKETMVAEGKKFHFKSDAFSEFYSLLNKEFQLVDFDAAPVINDMFLSNFYVKSDTLSAVVNILDVDVSRMNEIYDAFNKQTDIWLITRQGVTEELVSVLSTNFRKLVPFSFAIVFLILLLSFGRIELSLLAIIPIAVSWLWTVGIMGILGISFNIFNIIVLTFIFGLGIDYSIFIIKGLVQEFKYGKSTLDSYKVSVLLSVITTLLGIGALIFAKHPALKSIAAISIIGILSVLFITFTLPPIIFKWIITYKRGLRIRPVTFLDFIISVVSLFIFVAGAGMLMVNILILRVFPVSAKSKKLFFHYLLMYMARVIIYYDIFIKKRIINPRNEDFKKPAVIIANHQSHIDLMLILLLHPKILILTNNKQWNNKLYGSIIRYADFIPATEGYETVLGFLRSKVRDGYSVMVFPEGTRSDTGKIRRFHKGAFYLAKDLGLELLPIMIHGGNQLLKKSEFFLKRGSMTTSILPRIDLGRKEYGEDIRQQTKNVLKYFREEYAKLKQELESPEYFRDFIIKNYLYKGPVLELYLKIKLRLEKNYGLFNDLIPEKCIITDLGCGYGFLTYMLSLVSPARQITAVDYDMDKIAMANNCAIKTPNVNFISADINEFEMPESDVFILNDVLHYMPVELQVNTIERCIFKLNNGGMIIIRDADKDLKKRHLGTRLTEFFSTKTGFNKAIFRLTYISQDVIKNIVSRQNLNLEIIDSAKLTSNLVYIIRKL